MKWVKIFSELNVAIETIPTGTSKLVIIGENRICLSQINRQFFAIQDACPHNGESLSKGKINYLGEIVCPWHGYRFNIKSGIEGDHKCTTAKTYRLKVEEGGLFIFV